MKEVKAKSLLTGSGVARMLGVCHDVAVALPIPRFQIKSGTRMLRRYREEDVLKFIKDNTTTE